MRTIKFRGKRVDNEEWVYGYVYNVESKGLWFVDNGKTVSHQVISKTIGQFTGLYDKNGQEIYEWDIVKVTYNEYGDDTFHEIRYFVEEYNYPAFDLEPCIDFADGNSFQYAKLVHNIEVIGNIHDNKEIK